MLQVCTRYTLISRTGGYYVYYKLLISFCLQYNCNWTEDEFLLVPNGARDKKPFHRSFFWHWQNGAATIDIIYLDTIMIMR